MRFSQQEGYQLTRSRPYKKNDNPHVEQKNLQFVREVVGYQRLDTPEDVEWLNQVYAVLDPYANFFLPVRKLVHRQREERRVRKIYDQARSPFQRLIDLRLLDPIQEAQFIVTRQSLNPLQSHQTLERLLAEGPERAHTGACSVTSL